MIHKLLPVRLRQTDRSFKSLWRGLTGSRAWDTEVPVPSVAEGPREPALLQQTVAQNLALTADQFPNQPALIVPHQGVRYNYREFQDVVTQAARGFEAVGVQKGERLAIWAPNCYEWTVTQYAAAKVGAILVNVNPAYRLSELQYVLEQSGVSTIVLAPSLRDADFVSMLEQAMGEGPPLRRRIVLGDSPPRGRLWMGWADLLNAGDRPSAAAALRAREETLRPEDPFNIQYTSGTTGFPKAAMLSHLNVLNNGFFIGQGCGYTERDRVCIPVPLYHCFGMVLGNLACTTHGSAMVYPSPTFDARAALQAVQSESCTSLYGVPTMFIAELSLPDFKTFRVDSLRTGIMAGSPCPIEIMKKVRQQMHMEEVTICYGMTETSPVSFQTAIHDPVEKRVSTVGRIHPHLEAKVVDPETREVVPRGQTGELCVRGYSVMLGYYGDPTATDEAIDSDGFMKTGDLASMDHQGYLNIMGRIKDMVIRGGENVYPREVEEFLHQHPDIANVQVVGVPDPKYGEQLAAWVQFREGVEPPDEEELRQWCRAHLAFFKIPAYWKFVDSFPLTANGKVQKFKIREAFISELGLHTAAKMPTA